MYTREEMKSGAYSDSNKNKKIIIILKKVG